MGPVTLIENTKGVVVCPVLASPAPRITWRKDDVNILRTGEASKRLKFHENGRDLVFPNVTFEDAGTYTCEAENSRGSVKQSSVVTVGSKYIYLFWLLLLP